MAFYKYGRQELDYLQSRDAAMGAAIERIGFIERTVIPDPFTALIRFIIDQQISRKAAETVWQRFCALTSVSPEEIARLSKEEIQACGFSFKKVDYIRSTADAVLSGQVDLEGLLLLSDKEVIGQLSSLKGIGVWTAEMILLLSMERPDIVSWGDLGIRKGMMKLYNREGLTKKDFYSYCRLYSPYGSTASLYLWFLSSE